MEYDVGKPAISEIKKYGDDLRENLKTIFGLDCLYPKLSIYVIGYIIKNTNTSRIL